MSTINLSSLMDETYIQVIIFLQVETVSSLFLKHLSEFKRRLLGNYFKERDIRSFIDDIPTEGMDEAVRDFIQRHGRF